MARSRFQSRFAGRGPRRQTDWALQTISTTFVNVPAASVVLLSSFTSTQLASLAPATLIRQRGILSVASDQGAASEDQIGAVGCGFVTDRARIAGAASLPSPISDAGWEGWMWIQSFAQQYQFGTAVGRQPNMVPFTYVIDSKAMRKFTGDEALVLMGENVHATHGFEVSVLMRGLIKAG